MQSCLGLYVRDELINFFRSFFSLATEDVNDARIAFYSSQFWLIFGLILRMLHYWLNWKIFVLKTTDRASYSITEIVRNSHRSVHRNSTSDCEFFITVSLIFPVSIRMATTTTAFGDYAEHAVSSPAIHALRTRRADDITRMELRGCASVRAKRTCGCERDWSARLVSRREKMKNSQRDTRQHMRYTVAPEISEPLENRSRMLDF